MVSTFGMVCLALFVSVIFINFGEKFEFRSIYLVVTAVNDVKLTNKTEKSCAS